MLNWLLSFLLGLGLCCWFLFLLGCLLCLFGNLLLLLGSGILSLLHRLLLLLSWFLCFFSNFLCTLARIFSQLRWFLILLNITSLLLNLCFSLGRILLDHCSFYFFFRLFLWWSFRFKCFLLLHLFRLLLSLYEWGCFNKSRLWFLHCLVLLYGFDRAILLRLSFDLFNLQILNLVNWHYTAMSVHSFLSVSTNPIILS